MRECCKQWFRNLYGDDGVMLKSGTVANAIIVSNKCGKKVEKWQTAAVDDVNGKMLKCGLWFSCDGLCRFFNAYV